MGEKQNQINNKIRFLTGAVFCLFYSVEMTDKRPFGKQIKLSAKSNDKEGLIKNLVTAITQASKY